MRIAFGICSWGLGHASRTLPIIRRFAEEGDEVTVVSHGAALELLRNELDGTVAYHDLEDYLPPTTSNSKLVALDAFASIPRYLGAMKREHEFVERLLDRERISAVFSDNRFGFYSVRVPSFFMTHQLRIMNPIKSRFLESATERIASWLLKRVAGVIVPDFRSEGLSGRLAHGLSVIDERDVNYIGALSDFERHSDGEDIEVFASVSGPEPQRTAFEGIVLRQLRGFQGKAVISLGKKAVTRVDGQVEIRGLIGKRERQDLLNRSKVVISRSGYSTIMDMCALGKKSLLVPTPGQTEQEYLADYHMNRGSYFCVPERELDVAGQLAKVASRRPPRLQHSVPKAVENAVSLITQTAPAS